MSGAISFGGPQGPRGFAGSTVPITTYAEFIQPAEMGEVVVDVADGTGLSAGHSLYLIRNIQEGALFYEVVSAEGPPSNQMTLRLPIGTLEAPPEGLTVTAGSVYICGPRGEMGAGSAVTTAAASAATGNVIQTIFSGPRGRTITRVAIAPTAALTANGTNYRTAVLSEVAPDGTVVSANVATIDTTAVSWSAGVDVVVFSGSHSLVGTDNKLVLTWSSSGSGVVLPNRTTMVR